MTAQLDFDDWMSDPISDRAYRFMRWVFWSFATLAIGASVVAIIDHIKAAA